MRIASREESLSAGCFCHGHGWAFGTTRRGLRVSVVVGHLELGDVEQLMPLWVKAVDAGPHLSFIDATAFSGMSAAAYLLFAKTVARNALRGTVLHQAVAANVDLGGAIARGFVQVAQLTYPVTFCADRVAALAKIGHADAGDEVGQMMAAVRGVVFGARWFLRHGPVAELTTQGVCRHLAVSARTLQRRLAEAGTTFARELGEARLARAQALLRASDRPVAQIAAELGYRNQSGLTSFFRRQLKTTPSDWRRQARQGSG